MLTKERILDEIKRTTKQNGGVPLGMGRFEKETGIKPHEWGKYWPRWGDAQKEAGFSPNKLQSSYTDNFLLEKYIALVRHLAKFPTSREVNVARRGISDFPDYSTFRRFGTKTQLVSKVAEYCRNKGGYEDVIAIYDSELAKSQDEYLTEGESQTNTLGEVYLFKSGRYYKIGKSNDSTRRGSELRIQLPEKLNLIHSITTDDPYGVEAYWHKRFELKRMNGEWFNLNPSDVKSFRRWKRIS